MSYTTGIRIEVPQEIYDQLLEEQEKCRVATGKKPALSALLLESYVQKQSTERSEYIPSENEPQNQRNDKWEINTTARFELWNKNLDTWDKSLQKREKDVREWEKEVYEDRMEIIRLKSELLDEKLELNEKSLAGPEMVVNMKMQEYEMKFKNEKIEFLENEIRELKNSMQAEKRFSKENKESNTHHQEDGFVGKIKENALIIIGILGLWIIYLLSSKENQKMPPHLKGLSKFFDGIDDKEKQTMGDKLFKLATDNLFKSMSTEKMG